MKNSTKIRFFVASTLVLVLLVEQSNCTTQKPLVHTEQASVKKVEIKVILGSTRQGRTSEKIGNAIKTMTDKRTDITTEIVDLRDYNLPFIDDETPPAARTTITDPLVKRWSDKINSADAFIIVTPEYNAGYPGVLKNAMDILYKEWNNKPVGFVGFSGGKGGAAVVIAQLRQVARAFQMIPVETEITIPTAWKALDTRGQLAHGTIEQELNTLINQLVNAHIR